MDLEILFGEETSSMEALPSAPLDQQKAVSIFAERCVDLPEEEKSHLTLHSVARLLDLPAGDPRLMSCVSALLGAGLIEARAHYVDSQDNVYEFDAASYKAAREAGAFIDPLTGRMIDDTDLLAPFWAVTK